MPQRSTGPRPPCPDCQRGGRGPEKRRSRAWELGVRELMLGAAALGLVAGLGWASEGRVCEALGETVAGPREAALERYVEGRCEDGHCESIEVVAIDGCRAKVRVVERRFDDYGEEIGLFKVVEGLEFSPVLERWRAREQLDVKQLLGYPQY